MAEIDPDKQKAVVENAVIHFQTSVGIIATAAAGGTEAPDFAKTYGVQQENLNAIIKKVAAKSYEWGFMDAQTDELNPTQSEPVITEGEI